MMHMQVSRLGLESRRNVHACVHDGKYRCTLAMSPGRVGSWSLAEEFRKTGNGRVGPPECAKDIRTI